jgi:hypothetical protein
MPFVKNPNLQWQSLRKVLPLYDTESSGHFKQVLGNVCAVSPEYVAFGHNLHSSAPLFSLNLPAKHASQAPPFGPVYPAAHWQDARSAFPGSDNECAPHDLQSVDEVFAASGW